MSMDIFPRKPKKGPVELQLTALIDVFSMIVIFLILGGVFGAPDIVVPSDMRVPKSQSKEGIESAPRITIQKSGVSFSLVDGIISLQDFRGGELTSAATQRVKPKIAEYEKKQKEAKAPLTPLNLLADQDAPYQDVYDVVAAFRKLGFNSILFIATGLEKKQ